MKSLLLKLIVTQSKSPKGFTLIELLVVIVIIGILSAIALPSFLSQANKARLAEATTNVGAAARAQQVYFNDNSTFTTNLNDLEIGLSGTALSHILSAEAPPADLDRIITVKGWSQRRIVRSVSSVITRSTKTNGELATTSVFCQASNFNYHTGGLAIPNGAGVATPQGTNFPECPAGFLAQTNF